MTEPVPRRPRALPGIVVAAATVGTTGVVVAWAVPGPTVAAPAASTVSGTDAAYLRQQVTALQTSLAGLQQQLHDLDARKAAAASKAVTTTVPGADAAPRGTAMTAAPATASAATSKASTASPVAPAAPGGTALPAASPPPTSPPATAPPTTAPPRTTTTTSPPTHTTTGASSARG